MGLIASLARPGGNVTGLSNQQTDTAGKRLELLREVVPDLRRLAIMANVGFPEAALEMREVQAISKTLGLDVATSEIRRTEDISPAFAALKGQAEALYVTADTLINNNRISHQHVSIRCATADDVRFSGHGRSGRPHVLWSKLFGPVPPRRRFRRQDFCAGRSRLICQSSSRPSSISSSI